MALIERNHTHSLSEHAVGIELENKPNLEDFVNILLQNGYWVRCDTTLKIEDKVSNKVIVWISQERG